MMRGLDLEIMLSWSSQGVDRLVMVASCNDFERVADAPLFLKIQEYSAAFPDDRVKSQLLDALKDYFKGKPVRFDTFPIHHNRSTQFRQAVIKALRDTKHGETITYRDLAKKAGYPRSARAVGQVMAHNTVPLIIPCHRVLGCRGEWGGYSAPGGVSMKRSLMRLEHGMIRFSSVHVEIHRIKQ